MGSIASQITSLTIVYSTVYSDADQRNYQSSASLAFVRGIHRRPVNSPHKWPVTRKMYPFDDVIMDLCDWHHKGQLGTVTRKMFPFVTSSWEVQVLNSVMHCPALKRKCLHFDEIFITGCTGSCQNDNFQCSQWLKFRQNDDIFVSVRCVTRKYTYEQQNMADAKRGEIFKWRLRENYATFCHDVSEWFVRWVYVVIDG